MATTAGAVQPGITDRWILNHHDAWSRSTLSPLFVSLAHGALQPDLFLRWLLDRASIARAMAAASERVRGMLAERGMDFPVATVAREEAAYLADYAVHFGLDLESPYRLSYEAGRLVDLIDKATGGVQAGQTRHVPEDAPLSAPRPLDGVRNGSVGDNLFDVVPVMNGHGEEESPAAVGNAALCCAVTAIWAFMLVSWQGCSLSRRNSAISHGGEYPTHPELRHYLSRDESLVTIVEAQVVLESLLKVSSSAVDAAQAEKTFEALLKCRVATLDAALESGQKDGRAPVCEKCARKGHTRDRCTFKSRV